jgi:hypothetical protein
MPVDDLVITGVKTAEGERFLIGARARCELCKARCRSH